jgi:hypothetical protein
MEEQTMRCCTSNSSVLVAVKVEVPNLGSIQTTQDAPSIEKYAILENLPTAFTAEVKHHRWYFRHILRQKKDQLIATIVSIDTVVQFEWFHANTRSA